MANQRTSQRQMDRRMQDVSRVLISFAPNGMRLAHLRIHLTDMQEELMEQALDALIEQKRVTSREEKNGMVAGRVHKIYSLTDPDAYPMRETITIGGIEFPRMIQGDVAGAEDLNVYSEALAAYDAKIKSQIAALAADLTRRYWANIAVLFALFVAVFALILRVSDPIVIQGSAEALKVAQMSAARLLPLAVILFVFPILIWWIVRKF